MTVRALEVFASYRGLTGYDRHARAFVRELHRQGVAMRLHGQDDWADGAPCLPDQDPWFASLDRPVPARIALHFVMPHQARPVAGLINVNHTMFEATPAHATWIARTLEHDLVLLPCESSRRAWLAGGMPAERLRLAPLGVDAALYGARSVPLPLRRDNGVPVAEYRVRFLNVSVVGPRKNLAGLLRVWLRATSRADDAILILKLGCYWPGTQDTFLHQAQEAQEALGKRFPDAAPVHVLYDVLPDATMPRLYAAATHYLSMSHGEGWDLPMMEAGAAGLWLIAPDHSAYPAYLDRTVAGLIPSRPVPARYDGDPYYAALFQGASWWDPDEDAAVKLVRAAIDGPADWPGPARERILRDFTWEKATRRLIEVLTDAEDSRT